MEIKEQIEKIDKEMVSLRTKKNDLIHRYIADNGLHNVIDNIRSSNISCKIESFCYDNEDCVYVIHLDLMEKDFKARLQKKHRMIDEAFKGIDDEFLIRNIRIMGAI